MSDETLLAAPGVRRIKKTVTNSGDFDGVEVYLYEQGWRVMEVRDGSGNVTKQFIHGTQYVDELVMMRAKDKGDLYVHQDANWNVVALTDLGGSVVERYVYSPYGEVVVHQETSYGDRDGDGDVDSTDKGTPGTTCTGTVTGSCRILDLDFDGDYDSSDATLFDSLPQGLGIHPGRSSTAVDQPFAHQGLLADSEIGSYQNRHRAYAASQRRFAQRDPLLLEGIARSGYQDGMNVFSYNRLNPLGWWDATGTSAGSCCNHTNQDVDIRPEHGCTTDPHPGSGAEEGCSSDGYKPLPPYTCGECDGHRPKCCDLPGKIDKVSNGCSKGIWDGGFGSICCDDWPSHINCHFNGGCGIVDEWWH